MTDLHSPARLTSGEAINAIPKSYWDGLPYWESTEDASITVEKMISDCEVIVAGVDGGGLDDTLGLCLLGRHKVTGSLIAWTHSWCRAGLLKKYPCHLGRFIEFQGAGNLTVVANNGYDDIKSVVAILDRVKNTGILHSVAVDPYSIGLLIDGLASIGITQDGVSARLVGVGQGARLTSSINASARMLTAGSIQHSQDKCMDWQVSNLRIEPTSAGVAVSKTNDRSKKIDTVMAFFDAFHVMSSVPRMQ